MNKFEYSKTEYQRICEECMLSDEESAVLKLRCQGKSRIEMLHALEDLKMPMSLSTLNRKINKINSKIKKMVVKEKGDGE